MAAFTTKIYIIKIPIFKGDNTRYLFICKYHDHKSCNYIAESMFSGKESLTEPNPLQAVLQSRVFPFRRLVTNQGH